MNKEIIEINIDEEIFKQFKNIIKKSNKNLNEITSMMVHKTVTEGNLDWLYGKLSEVETKNVKANKAIQLFKQKGFNLCKHNTTFATKNTNNEVYWLNPDKRHLSEDWYIILNDNIYKILYLLFVPKNSIKELKLRNDRECNVSIRYNDLNFLDIHSGIPFGKYLISFIEYETLV